MTSRVNGTGAHRNGVPAGAVKAKQRQLPVVVPVIPLPLMQRKQAAPKPATMAVPTTPASMTRAEPATDPAAPHTEKAVSVSISPLDSPATVSVALPTAAAAAAAAANGAPPSPTSDAEPDKNAAGRPGIESNAHVVQVPASDVARPAAHTDENNLARDVVLESNTPSSIESPPTNATTPMPAEPVFAPQQPFDAFYAFDASASAAAPAAPQNLPHPALSLPRYHPPSVFQPAIRNGEGPRPMRLALDGQPPMHRHAHAGSNGSAKLQFGPFSDPSHNPSPVPHSGGIAPPPGIPLDNRHGSGYGPGPRPAMQFRQDANIDGFGRHGGPFPHHINHFSPSTTPHSFQGSQASAQDDGTVFGAFTPGLNIAGSAAAAADDERRMFSPAGHHNMMPPPMPPPPHMMHMLPPEADGLRDYIKGAFDDGLFRDCLVILNLPNMKDAVQIAGHRLIFARSPVLRDLILHDRSGSSRSTIHLGTDDRNVRPDSFFLAVRRLYGYDLFIPTAPPPAAGSKAATSNLVERFNYTLGYAASGCLLRWESVIMRGMEAAARMLEWPVLERALDFLLGGVAFRGAIDRESQLAYGEPSLGLMGGVIYFITNNFPHTFVLDPSVDDPPTYARLPDVLGTFARSPRDNTPIARGTSVHRPRLSHIKFGDIVAPASPVPHVSPIIQAILSRVLLNLPFILLEPILEQVVASAMMGPSSEARQQVVRGVMMEREARRLRVVDAVLGGRVPAAAGIKRGLQSTQPRAVDEWDVLGWAEELGSPHDPSLPFSLARRWTPLRDIPGNLDDQPMYP